jgi:serine/threonine protein phosphatase PrpC
VDELVQVLQGAVQQACRDIHNRSRADSSLSGMGCTATAVVVAGHKAVMAHVGDTRLYLVRNGRAHQLSSDHTLAAELARQGAIPADQLAGHPQSHILTRALGSQASVEVETLVFDVVAGDRLILCSDGLSGAIPSTTWLAQQAGEHGLEDLPDVLVEQARAAGGRDNITVVVAAVEGSPVEPVPAHRPQLTMEILASSFLFADLSLAQLARLIDRCQARVYEPGEVIRNYGDQVDELLVVVSGSLRLTTIDGRTASVGAGQHLGEHLVLRPRPARAVVTVEERATVLALGRADLLDLSARRPWLGVALLSRLAERLSGDVDRLSVVSDLPPRELAGDLL